MPAQLKDSVVVITGASSGIGRAAAVEFARHGASVVLSARSEEPLEEVAKECQQIGAKTVAVPADVADAESVKNLARRAVESFGHIDVWVNNAAVTLFARFEEAPLEAYRQVIETNLFGYIYGAREAIPHFKQRGHGVLINVSSVVGTVGQPMTSAYVSSKFAIRGLSECLRQELRGTDVHVCTVMPATVDTPLFQHGANYTGREPQAMPPVYSAQSVAETIVGLATRPRREVFVGGAGRAVNLMHRLMPGLTERMVARQAEHGHFQDRSAGPDEGNLFEPEAGQDRVSGGWRNGRSRSKGAYTAAALAVALPAAAGWLWFRQKEKERNRMRYRMQQIRKKLSLVA